MRWILGTALIYRCAFASETRFKADVLGDPGDGSHRSLRIEIDGMLQLVVVETERDGATLALTLIGPRVQVGWSETGAAKTACPVEQELQDTVFVRCERGGLVDRVWAGSIQDPIAIGVVGSIMSSLQWWLPVGQEEGSQRWVREEEDLAGAYVAEYSVLPRYAASGAHARTQTVLKRKLQRPQLTGNPARGDAPLEAAVVEPVGESRIAFDPHEGVLVSVQVEEETRASIGHAEYASATMRTKLDLVSRSTLPGRALDEFRREYDLRRTRSGGSRLSSLHSPDHAERDRHLEVLGEATLEDLFVELDALDQRPGTLEQRWTLLQKLHAILYVQPESTAALGEALAASNGGSRKLSLLARALCWAGDEEAQEALVAVIRRRRKDVRTLEAILPALSKVRAPGQGLEDALLEIATDSPDAGARDLAEASLGVLARSLAEAAPERSEEITRWILGRLADAKSDEARARYLRVLGNTGSPLGLEFIGTSLEFGGQEVRMAAASALRGIPGAGSDQLLVQVLSGDPDESVRVAAASVLTQRPADRRLALALMEAVRSDPSEVVQLKSLHSLWQRYGREPEVVDLVRAVSESGEPRETREAARRLLQEVDSDDESR
jgi:hypothetical protein